MSHNLKNSIIEKSFEFEDESGIIMERTITLRDLYEILDKYEITEKEPLMSCKTTNCRFNDNNVCSDEKLFIECIHITK